MLTWEFPPRKIGGIASHVYDLSRAIARRGTDVHVVTCCEFPGAPPCEEVEGVHVYRFNPHRTPVFSFLSWVFSMNICMVQRGAEVIDAYDGQFNLIHAHDWLVARAAVDLKGRYGKPLVSTFHSTEAGRRDGIHDGYQKAIHDVEFQLAHQSDRLICCSEYMAKHMLQTFGVPKEKVDIVYNGVEASKFNFRIDARMFRERYARPNEKIVLYVGRLVREKGVHVLIGAMPRVLSVLPDVKLIIVGEGKMKETLQEEARQFGVAHKVLFTGFVGDETLQLLYKISDLAVFPSLYEPFGIVALEAMAAMVPVVVSDVGGLAEVVEHEKTGVKVYPDNSASLAWGILRVLRNPEYADKLRRNAYLRVLNRNDWDALAENTAGVYEKALASPLTVSAMHRLQVKMLEPKPLTKYILLPVLYTLGTVKRESSRSVKEIAELCRVPKGAIFPLMRELVKGGYVTSRRDPAGKLRYWLTKKGIVRACSLFT